MNNLTLLIAVLLCYNVVLAYPETKISSIDSSSKSSQAVSVLGGVFAVDDSAKVFQKRKIVVKDAENGSLVGIYRPHKKTGKFIFILPAGKSYKLDYELGGNLIKSENLIVPSSTIYSKLLQKIDM